MKPYNNYFHEITCSDTEMLFAYDKKADSLYLSARAAAVLDCNQLVRRYWVDSQNWNWISQQKQEELVNCLRHEVQGNEMFAYTVQIRKNKDEGAWYQLELYIVWNERIEGDILGVRGKMLPAKDPSCSGMVIC